MHYYAPKVGVWWRGAECTVFSADKAMFVPALSTAIRMWLGNSPIMYILNYQTMEYWNATAVTSSGQYLKLHISHTSKNFWPNIRHMEKIKQKKQECKKSRWREGYFDSSLMVTVTLSRKEFHKIVQLRIVQLWPEFNDLFELRILIYLLLRLQCSLRRFFSAMVAKPASAKLARKQPFSELAKPAQLLSWPSPNFS